MKRVAVWLGVVLAVILVSTIWYQGKVIQEQEDLIKGITQNPCGFRFTQYVQEQ